MLPFAANANLIDLRARAPACCSDARGPGGMLAPDSWLSNKSSVRLLASGSVPRLAGMLPFSEFWCNVSDVNESKPNGLGG